jgi:hypothetical protein
MTLQHRCRMEDNAEWEEWKDWAEDYPIKFQHRHAKAYAHEVREKPPFEPGFFWNGSTAVEWVDNAEWFGDFNRNWTRVKVVQVS